MIFALYIIYFITSSLLASEFTTITVNGAIVRNQELDPEAYLTVSEIVRRRGYEAEEHFVTTEDGYILMLHRVLPKINRTSTSKPRVVVLQHGLVDSAHCWISNQDNESLAFLMADAGYDVWMPNSRGNTYSRRHISLLPQDAKFWDFSWDEMAAYDLPASIYYIINTTGVEKVAYVGHSQGCQIAFAGFGQDAQLRSRISAFSALAPVAFLGAIRSPLRYMAPIAMKIEWLIEAADHGEFLPSSFFFHFLGRSICKLFASESICSNVLFLITGYDVSNMNKTRLPIYISHTPAGTSVKNMAHYCLNIFSNRFQKYDYGAHENLKRYGTWLPPQYSFDDFDIPTAVFYGSNDRLADPTDVEKLMANLGKRAKLVRKIPGFNHLDFTWGINANLFVYKDTMQFLKNYDT